MAFADMVKEQENGKQFFLVVNGIQLLGFGVVKIYY
jgi:hypothetical protein